MKITMNIKTDNYDKSIVIDDLDIKVYTNIHNGGKEKC
jgi:hypothetical protein